MGAALFKYRLNGDIACGHGELVAEIVTPPLTTCHSLNITAVGAGARYFRTRLSGGRLARQRNVRVGRLRHRWRQSPHINGNLFRGACCPAPGFAP